MTTQNNKPDFADFQSIIEVFFAKYPNDDLRARTFGVLMELLETDATYRGDLRGWVGGLVYAVNNDGRFPCGVDGVSNRELSEAFGVRIETIRTRAATIKQKLGWMPKLTGNL